MKWLAIFLALSCATAHELQDNRATLVLRDRTHVSVTLYIAYTEALHQALAPQRPLPEFLFLYSTVPLAELEKDLARAHAKFQSATRMVTGDSVPVPLSNWVWPNASQVQSLLRQRVMASIAAPDGHIHEEPVEIHADANATREITSIQVQFPDEFQSVLVVAYRPTQTLVESKSLSHVIRF
jgi:hypothetical protein